MSKSKNAAQQIEVRVGAVQMISQIDDTPGNIDKALSYCDRAAKKA